MKRWLAIALLVFGIAARAGAQPSLLGAGGVHFPGLTPSLTHAWFVLEEKPGAGVTVFHVPPRRDDARVTEGSVRVAATLRNMPTLVAARDNRLYMVFDVPHGLRAFEGPGPARPREVHSLATVRGADGAWTTPVGDALRVEPVLPGEGDLLAMAASGPGVFVLRRVPGGTGRPVLNVLADGAWLDVPLPRDVPEGAGARLLLAGTTPGVAIIAVFEDRAVWWGGELTVAAGAEESTPPAAKVAWESARVITPSPILQSTQTSAAVGGGHAILGGLSSGAWRWAAWPLNNAETMPTSAPGMYTDLPVIKSPAPYNTMVCIDSDDRALVIGVTPAPDSGPPGVRLTEVSIRSGRPLYEGSIELSSPVSRTDLILLGVVMAMVLGMVAVTVISPAEPAIALPEDASLAEAPRRFVAGAVDLTIGLVVAMRIVRVDLGEALNSGWWSSADAYLVVMVSMGVLIVYGTILERTTGRTVGKALTACEVIDARAAARSPGAGAGPRPTLIRCFVRNAVKWGLPPIGLLGVFAADGRHRADQIARTAVVIREPPEEPEE